MTWQLALRIVNGVLNLSGARIGGVNDGVADNDAATVGQVKGRTPQITVGPTPPDGPDTNDLWVVT